MKSKQLLVFAHQGEAAAFMNGMNFVAKEWTLGRYFENDGYLLVVTGEGSQTVLSVLSGFLANRNIELIRNFGVCATLSSLVSVGQVCSVRTVYAESARGMEFKSFSSCDEAAKIDCISAWQRILDEEYADRLENFAPLADRELWSIAYVANTFKIPFSAHKVVSDRPSDQSECENIRAKAAEFSEMLWQTFCSLEKPPPRLETRFPEGFYFTASQRQRFISLIRALKLRFSDEEVADLANTIGLQADLSPKQKTAVLLDELNRMKSPATAQIDDQIDRYLSSLKGIGIKVRANLEEESLDLALRLDAKNPTAWKRALRSIEQLDIGRFKKLIEGESLDV